MVRISLQILIIIWWIGAAIASIAVVIHKHGQYALIGTTGWVIVITSTALIIYEIKRIKEEVKKRR
jgi:FtsH-binding integral membrane protein